MMAVPSRRTGFYLVPLAGLLVAALASVSGLLSNAFTTPRMPGRATGRSLATRYAAVKTSKKPAAPKMAMDEEEDLDAYPNMMEEYEEAYGDGGAIMEPPSEVVQEWVADDVVQEIFTMFRSEEGPGVSKSYGKDDAVLSYYDVAKLLETLGLEKETFVDMFLEPEEGEEEYGEDDFEDFDEFEEEIEEPPRAKGGRGQGRGRGR
mmetsp:Transcript_59575/g.141761  ORF Transcript_59575/g.141761 Transcript_59575/m.141761 type:complete len:205 (+) Transcript_59575:77-691(+)